MARKAKSWAEYRQWQKAKKQWDSNNVQHAERIQQTVAQDKGNERAYLYRPEVVKAFSKAPQAVTNDTRKFYADNPRPAITERPGYQPRTEAEKEQDPRGDDQIRNNVLDAISSELLTPQQREEQAAIAADPQAAQDAIKQMMADNGVQETPALVKFLDGLMNSYDWMNQQITHPLKAAMIATNPNTKEFGDIEKAWEASDAVGFFEDDPEKRNINPHTGHTAPTFGQTVIANPIGQAAERAAVLPLGLMPGADYVSGDPNDVNMQARFEQEDALKYLSGGVDLGQQSVGDGMGLAAKALKWGWKGTRLLTGVTEGATRWSSKDAATGYRYLRNALEASTGTEGKSNGVGELADWLLKEKSTQRITQRFKQMGAGDRSDVAHMFASVNENNGGRERINRLILAGAGEPRAIKELYDTDPHYYLELLRRGERADEWSEYGARVMGLDKTDPGYAQTLKDHKDDLIGKGWAAAIAEDPELGNRVIKSYADANPALAKELGLASSADLNVVGSLGNADLGSKSVLGQKFANARASAIADGQFTHGDKSLPLFSRFIDSPISTAIAVIRWPAKKTPTGIVGTRGVAKEGSNDELVATMEVPKALRGKEHREFKNGLLDIWAANSHLDARSSRAVQQIETSLFSRLANVKAVEAAQRKGLVEGTGEYQRYVDNWVADKEQGFKLIQDARDGSAEHVRTHGYDVDQVNQQLVVSPQLQAHLRDGVPILDFNIIEKQLDKSIKDPYAESWVKSGGPPEKFGNPVTGGISGLNDSFQSVWRPLVLMRAAYPIRNTLEGYSRVLGFTGFANSFMATAEQLGASGKNAGRKIGNLTGEKGRASKALTYESSEFDRKVATLEEARANLAHQAQEIATSGAVPKAYGQKSRFNHNKLLDDLRAQDVDALDETHPLSQLDGSLDGFSLSEHAALADAVDAAAREVDAARPALLNAQGRVDAASKVNVMRDGQTTRRLGDGSYVQVNDTFGGKQGGIAQAASASTDSWNTMINANTSMRQRLMRNKLTLAGYQAVDPVEDVDAYKKALDHFTNRILKDSAVMQMRLDPSKTADDFVDWLYKPQGRMEKEAQRSFNAGRKGKPGTQDWDKGERAWLEDWYDVDNPEAMKAWFESGRENLLQTIPDPEFRNLIREGNVTPGAIDRYIDRVGIDKLPKIISDQVFSNHGAGHEGRSWWRGLTNTFFHYAGAVPETVLVRQPYYSIRQREFLDNMLPGLTKDTLENTDVLAKTMQESHRYALRRLKRDIYTIERQRNLPKMVENVSPFWTAQLNTTATWPRLIMERPQSLAAIARLYGRMRDQGFIDDFGTFNPVPGNPKLGWGSPGGLDVKIPFGNIMSVFAGQTNDQISELPGASIWGPFIQNPGPYMQWALSEAQRGHPGFAQLAELIPENVRLPFMDHDIDVRENVYKWANSSGPSTEAASLDKLLPGYLRQVFAKVQGEGNGTFDGYAALITANEWAKYDQGLRDKPPTGDEVRDLTNQLLMTVIVGQFTSPGNPRVSTPIYPMVLKAREFTSKYGYIDGANKFLAVYGEEWRAALMHGTKNEFGYGVEQSKESWKILQDNPDLVRKLANDGDPELVALLMGAGDGHGNFDPAVRRLMQASKIPGQDGNILQAKTPEEMIDELRQQRSWAQYRAGYTTWKDAKIAEWTKKYGSTVKIPSERWAELKAHKQQVIAGIAQDNPDWAKAYNAQTGKNRQALAALKEVMDSPKFADKVATDPYWQTVKQFVDMHDSVAKELGGAKPNYGATTPEEYFIKNDMKNKKKGYHFSAESTAKYREKIMKQFKTPGTGFYKQWQLAKYRAAVEDLKKKNVRFNDMHERWFGGEDFDDNAFIGG